ncbi:hypothetical protein BCR42DRAFT_497111 [Absidia repens]|uniref:Heterokaryon incompatibility domain-containing protein n=1 Tax=Absidia repens TaxID=90262 RepID=A0A1X2HWW5_9FUNG|nr:hypothetical protein BCR42DRAFT_497111 [Absidia repens]
MTIDGQVNQSSKEQEKKKPFQVVLVDIEKTVADKVIHCVKKTLEDDDLKYVALSYRWGELHETLVDTGVGYTASITSFHLDDFYKLCYTMTLESDMKDIKYLWVDAICVDQNNPVRRKATIYQMSNIYDRATYILAVPDLPLTYIKGVSTKNYDTINAIKAYRKDIYHLLHGNTTEFNALEEAFLNDSSVPKEPPELRQLLVEYTDYFGHSFTTYEKHHTKHCPVRTLDHICKLGESRPPTNRWKFWIRKKKKHLIGDNHWCDDATCPLKFRFDKDMDFSWDEEKELNWSKWKSKIMNRGNSIRQAMELMTDLVKDWSSRVWVVSEYSIAKRKNNLKYWFTQFSFTYGDDNGMDEDLIYYFKKNGLHFFKFDFNDPLMDAPYYSDQGAARLTRGTSTNPIYIRFHYTMTRHLAQQTFLEMILFTKASRNEDRFYSVLPLSEYHEKKKEVSNWNVGSLLSVKLKLYEIMNSKDKLFLLFWSTNIEAIHNNVLPTFASSTLPTDFETEHLLQLLTDPMSNFDVDDPCTLQLLHDDKHADQNNNSDDNDDDDEDHQEPYDYLRLKPKEYYAVDYLEYDYQAELLTKCIPRSQRIGIHDATPQTLDVVAIPAIQWESGVSPFIYRGRKHFLYLVGSFATNKWTMFFDFDYDYRRLDEELHVTANDTNEDVTKSVTFFDIY